jgi:ABC-2 type transport system permease protein
VVAALLSLRFRVLANTLQRNVLQLVAVVIGGMFTVLLVAIGVGGMIVASLLPPSTTQAIVVIGGSTLVLGWLVIPLLFDGVDRTLDPRRLSRFPLPTSTLMAATLLVAVTWVPGAATVVVSLSTAIAWRGFPAASVVAVMAGLVGATTCIVGAQLTTSVVGTLLRGRGAVRVAVGALGLVLLVTPIALATFGGSGSVSAPGSGSIEGFAATLEALGWTPFGAVWSVPGRLAQGDLGGAALAAVIALGTLAGLVLLWRLALRADPRGGGERRSGRAGARGLGLLGMGPARPTAAVFARSLIYWFRDSRQAKQLLLLPVLPALMLIWWRLFDLELIALAIGPIVASLLPLSAFAALSYDGTAFAAQLSAGVRGVSDRIGRAAALLVVAAPATVIVQVAVAVLIGRAADLPALLGLSLGVLLISLGVSSVSSARLVMPMPRAGRNPFSAQPGAATSSIFASYAVAMATLVLSLPVALVVIVAFVTRIPALGWLGLIVGVLGGLGVSAAGIVIGGRILDSSGPEMLSRLRLVRV